MGLAFAIFFPLGAAILRALNFGGLVWFHAGWQIFTYCIAIAGLGLGIWIADTTDQVRRHSANASSLANMYFRQLHVTNPPRV